MPKCKRCGKELYLEDVFDEDGCLTSGYIVENQLWHCDNCDIEFIVTQQLNFKPEDIETLQIMEN